MNGPEKVHALRTTKLPVLGRWSGNEWEAHGSLCWENDEPVLILFVHAPSDRFGDDPERSKNAAVKALAPPNQPTITGLVQSYGTITLEGCARVSAESIPRLEDAGVDYVFTIRPTTVWLGSCPNWGIANVELNDTRLGGFFSGPEVKLLRPSENNAAFALMGEPHRVLTVSTPSRMEVKLGQSAWELILDTRMIETFSALSGHSLRSLLGVNLVTPPQTGRKAAERCVFELETIFSTFSLEPFTFEYVCYSSAEREEAHLVWRLGEDRSRFNPPMRHQVLVNFRDNTTFKTILERWFEAEDEVRLARWLFGRALRETTDGLARFVSVAQAFEALGRAGGSRKAMSTERIKIVSELVTKALVEGEFDEEFIDRVAQLIASSNRKSFQDVLIELLRNPNERYRLATDDELRAFCRTAVTTRNAVVHMSNNGKTKLDDAFGRVNKLGPQLCLWFALQVAADMDVAVPDVMTFIYNNRVGRMGLPPQAYRQR